MLHVSAAAEPTHRRPAALVRGLSGVLVSVAAVLTGGCEPVGARDPFADRFNDGEAGTSEAVAVLGIGDRVPAFRLRDHHGAALPLPDGSARATVVTFFESRSPEPELCPALRVRLAELAATLHPELAEGVRLIAVTVDPEYDTTEVLRSLAAASDGDLLVYAAASAEETARLTGSFGVLTWARQDGSIAHTLSTVVIDARGRLADRFPGVLSWSTRDLLASVSLAATR